MRPLYVVVKDGQYLLGYTQYTNGTCTAHWGQDECLAFKNLDRAVEVANGLDAKCWEYSPK